MKFNLSTKTLIIFILLLSFKSSGQENDPFDWTYKPITSDSSSESSGSSESENKNFVLHWGTDKTKIIEKVINSNVQRAAVLIASAVLTVYSARALLQKKPNPKAYSLLASSLISLFYNKELVSILNTKLGKLSLVTILITYLHKEILGTILPNRLFNLIYRS